MSKKAKIVIRIPSEAQSQADSPYLEHQEFIKYCTANGVSVNEDALEAFEKKGLLYPCFRVLYPQELLRRRFRAGLPYADGLYTVRDEWRPLIDLEEAMHNSRIWLTKEFSKAIDFGHPFERSLQTENPFVNKPINQEFKAWKKFVITEGVYEGRRSPKSRATHYYSTWKLFIIDELNKLNTYKHNRATGLMSGRVCFNNGLVHSSLHEFSSFFMMVADFSFRRDLLKTEYFENSKHTASDWGEVVSRSETTAKLLFGAATYSDWIRYLRKLIDLYETFNGNDEFRLAEETKSYILRAVIFLGHSTTNNFHEICKDVDGAHEKYSWIYTENGVNVYPGSLERMFPDEKWDLEQNVRDSLTAELKKLNSILLEHERMPNALCDQLFDELAEKPEGTALAAIRRINKVYSDPGLWRTHEIWSGIGDLSRAVEVHGKEWIGGASLEGVLLNLLKNETLDYKSLKNLTGKPDITKANSSDDFLEKLALLASAAQIPNDRRYGRHLLVAHLTRNYASHQKGLARKKLNDNFYNIYFSLISTLFVIYARYRKQ